MKNINNPPGLRAIAPLFMILLLDALSFGLILPELGQLFLKDSLFLPVQTSAMLRDVLYSVTISLPLLGMLFGAPLLGSLSDKFGRKYTLLLSLLGSTGCFILSGVSIALGSVVCLLLSRATLGVLNGNESIAQAAIADLSRGTSHKALSMSLITVGGSIGFIIGPLLGGYFSDSSSCYWFNYQTPFYVAAVFCVISALLLIAFFQETHTQRAQFPIRWQASFESVLFAFSQPQFRYLSLMYFCMEFAWGLYFQSIALLLLLGHGFSSREIGLFMTYIAVCFMLTLMTLMRILHKRFTSLTIVKVGMLLLGLGGFCTLLSPTTMNVLVMALFTTAGVGLTYNTLLALFSNAGHETKQGHTMGMALAIGAIAWILAALFSGILSGLNLYLPYILIGVMGVLGAFFAHCSARYGT